MEALWRIELLGGFRVVRDQQVITRFPTRKTEVLLAYLAYYPHRCHPRNELVEILWPEGDPHAGRHRLSQALSSLRHHLEPPGTPAGAVLIADRFSVRLDAAAAITDVAQFEAALRSAERAGSITQRAQLLADAVALYRGRLLPGCYEAWALVEQERQAETYFQALRQLAGLMEQAGDIDRALDYARRAVGAEPLREEAHSEVMRLLAAAGQPSRARRQYHELARIMKEELGVEPSAATSQLADRLSAGSWQLAVERNPSTPPPRSSNPPPHLQVEHTGMAQGSIPPCTAEAGIAGNLPLPFTRFFGREEEMARLQEMLLGPETTDQGPESEHQDVRPARPTPSPPAVCRLVTLTGPGGSGKTRLAQAVAERLLEKLSGAVWFVLLADLSDPLRIVDAVRQALRLPHAPGIEPLEQVVEALSHRPAVLVLDNFEHLVTEGALLVRTLLARVPALTCLVTSRQRLNVSGEREFSLRPLPTPDPSAWAPERVSTRFACTIGRSAAETNLVFALSECPSVQLFVDRAQAVRPDFQVTEANATAVAELCHRLEGIPLALELAAARTQVLTPAQMLAHLEHRFDFLVSRERDAAARHRTLRAAIEWSHRLLSPELQRFFARLSVFRGGWTLEAAEAVCLHGPAVPDVLDYLAQLRECSLLVADPQAPAMRFRMLETLREYAREQLTDDERAGLERCHAGYYLALAEEVAAHFEDAVVVERSARPEALDALDAEYDNLRAALAWVLAHDPEWGLRLAGALGPFWQMRCYWTEACAAMRQALERGADAPVELQTKVLGWAGLLEALRGESERARELLLRGLEMCRARQDRRSIAKSLTTLGCVAYVWNDRPFARACHEESLEIQREIGDKKGMAWSLTILAHLRHAQGDDASAAPLYEAGLALFRETGNRKGLATSLNFRGCDAFARRDFKAARTYHQESLAVCRENGNKWEIAETLTLLGRVAHTRGEQEAARAYHEESLALFRETGNRQWIALALSDLGNVALALDDLQAAHAYYEESLTVTREIGDRWSVAQAHTLLGYVARAQGELQAARALHEESLSIRRETGNPWQISESLAQLGDIALAQGDTAAERAYYQEGLAILRQAADKPRLNWTDEHAVGMLEGMARLAAGEAGDALRAGDVRQRRGRRRRGQAVRLYAAAEALRESMGVPLPPAAQRERGESLAALREALGERAFTSAWSAGRALTWTQAAACALEVARQRPAARAVLSSSAPNVCVKSTRDPSARPVRRTPCSTDLTDAQWDRIEPLIPPAKPGGRHREVDLRAVVDAILYYVCGAAGGWRRLPHGFPPWGTVHYYYWRWCRDGTWQQIGQALGLPGVPDE